MRAGVQVSRQLTDMERDVMSKGFCPDCGHRGFVLGPRGGAAINVSCGGGEARFNVPTFGHDVVMGERLPRDAPQGAPQERGRPGRWGGAWNETPPSWDSRRAVRAGTEMP